MRTQHEVINHRPVCTGSMTCIQCGRKACRGCLVTEQDADPKIKGKCAVCAGMFTEEDITLFPAPIKEWDK